MFDESGGGAPPGAPFAAVPPALARPTAPALYLQVCARILIVLLCTSACYAEDWEIGAALGYGWYHNGTVFAPAGTAQAGIRNRFVAGAVLSNDAYPHLSGEVRYVYHDGDPFLSSGGVKENQQGQSHTFVYDLLFQVNDREHKIRPYLAAGAGAKLFRISGPPLRTQPLSDIATLSTSDDIRLVVSLGAGVKYRAARHVIVRFDFRDYISPFPSTLIQPAPFATGRGLLHQFTPTFGLSYSF